MDFHRDSDLIIFFFDYGFYYFITRSISRPVVNWDLCLMVVTFPYLLVQPLEVLVDIALHSSQKCCLV